MALARVNSARSLVTSSSCSYFRKPSTCIPVSQSRKLITHPRRQNAPEPSRALAGCTSFITESNAIAETNLLWTRTAYLRSCLTFRQPPVNSRRTHRIILHTALSNQVDDTCCIRKRGHILADLVDGEDEIVGQVAR